MQTLFKISQKNTEDRIKSGANCKVKPLFLFLKEFVKKVLCLSIGCQKIMGLQKFLHQGVLERKYKITV